MCVCVCAVKLVTVVESEPKAPFLIATSPRRRGGHYFFPWITQLYPCSLPYNAGGARGVMVIVVGNRHADTSSNPGPG